MTSIATRIRSFPLWVAVGFLAMAVAFLTMSQCERRRANERIGELRERAARLARDSVDAANTVRRTDSVFFRDTVRLGGARTRWRTVVDSLLVSDTVTLRDSIIIAAADTVIRACQAALVSCTQRVAARDSLLRVIGDQRRNEQALFRARLRRANPRMVPYVEALTNPFDTRVFSARAGLEARFLGPIRLSAALSYRTQADRPFSVLAGVRVTF